MCFSQLKLDLPKPNLNGTLCVHKGKDERWRLLLLVSSPSILSVLHSSHFWAVWSSDNGRWLLRLQGPGGSGPTPAPQLLGQAPTEGPSGCRPHCSVNRRWVCSTWVHASVYTFTKHFLDLMLSLATGTRKARQALKCELDVPYGSGRQKIDFYYPHEGRSADKESVFVFIHGGYWQALRWAWRKGLRNRIVGL